MPLQLGDLNRRSIIAMHDARAFAQHLYRANARTAPRQHIRFENATRRTAQIAAGNPLDEPRNINVRGAGNHAGRIEAIETSVRFNHRNLFRQRCMQLAKALTHAWIFCEWDTGIGAWQIISLKLFLTD